MIAEQSSLRSVTHTKYNHSPVAQHGIEEEKKGSDSEDQKSSAKFSIPQDADDRQFNIRVLSSIRI